MATRSDSLINATNTLLDTLLSGYKWDISNSTTISLGVTNGVLGIAGDPSDLDSDLAKAILDLMSEDLERFLPIYFDSSSPGLSVNYVHPNALSSTADITFSPFNPNGWGPTLYNLSSTTMGIAEFPSPSFYEFEPDNPGVDVILNEIYLTPSNMQPGGVGFSLIYHEFGHALGLKHPFDSMNGFTNFDAFGLPSDPGNFITVMSYEDPSQTSIDGYGASFGFMALDVLALQHLYGKREDFNIENNEYDVASYSAEYGDIWYTLYDCGGVDTVSFQEADESWMVDLSLGLSSSRSEKSGVWLLSNKSSLNSILGSAENSYENIIGSNYADTLTGNSVANNISAGSGNDTIDGGAGNDTYNGGTGVDTIKYTSATAAITVDLLKGTATSTAGKNAAKIGTDTLSGIENVIAGKYNDIVKGSTGANVLTGGLGSDRLYGGADRVKDVFDFNAIAESKVGTARDKVYNFLKGIDDLDLKTIDANTTKADNQQFGFSTVQTATKDGTVAKANSVWWRKADVDNDKMKDDIIVYGDVNGDTKADFEIGLIGVTSLTSADFVL